MDKINNDNPQDKISKKVDSKLKTEIKQETIDAIVKYRTKQLEEAATKQSFDDKIVSGVEDALNKANKAKKIKKIAKITKPLIKKITATKATILGSGIVATTSVQSKLGFFAVLKAKILKMFLIFKGGKAVVLGAGVVSVPLYTFLDKYKGMSQECKNQQYDCYLKYQFAEEKFNSLKNSCFYQKNAYSCEKFNELFKNNPSNIVENVNACLQQYSSCKFKQITFDEQNTQQQQQKK